LAVIRAEVDLALARPRRDDLDDASLRSIRDEVSEFERLIEALLLAARADAGSIQAVRIDLGDLVARATERLEPFAESRPARIVNDIEGTPVIAGDPDILERLLVSLLHNGIKFPRCASSHGQVMQARTLEGLNTRKVPFPPSAPQKPLAPPSAGAFIESRGRAWTGFALIARVRGTHGAPNAAATNGVRSTRTPTREIRARRN
jgi:hypothetical protein